MNDPVHRALRYQARTIYGEDPAAYEFARPEYPTRVYEILSNRCGLRAGCDVLEIGPGTGKVTRRLSEFGAHVVAVEPDPRLARLLQSQFAGQGLEIIEASFEDAHVRLAAFDLAVAATSFHWVDQEIGLPKLGSSLRRGGWAAIWWTVFGDPEADDPFADEVATRVGEDLASQRDGTAFQLDVDARTGDLRSLAGLVNVTEDHIRWSSDLPVDRLLALYASQIRIQLRPEPEREHLLETIRTVAAQEPGGSVRRPFVTAIYTGCKP